MRPVLGQRLDEAIELFKEKGATSKKKALSLKKLGLPLLFKHIVRSPLGERLPFVEVDGKYYLDEQKVDEMPVGPFQKWMKHTSRVPRGYLRLEVLRLLSERPMSGSEITSEIETKTGGRWKPSPGSIYPLLKNLSKDGLIEELPIKGGIKRYKMTKLGKALLSDKSSFPEIMQERIGSGPFPFGPPVSIPAELEPVREKLRKVFEQILVISGELAEEFDEEIAEEFTGLVDTVLDRLDEMVERLESRH